MPTWPAYARLSAVGPASHLPTAPTPSPERQPRTGRALQMNIAWLSPPLRMLESRFWRCATVD
jgi:hypothetical protein